MLIKGLHFDCVPNFSGRNIPGAQAPVCTCNNNKTRSKSDERQAIDSHLTKPPYKHISLESNTTPRSIHLCTRSNTHKDSNLTEPVTFEPFFWIRPLDKSVGPHSWRWGHLFYGKARPTKLGGGNHQSKVGAESTNIHTRMIPLNSGICLYYFHISVVWIEGNHKRSG